MLITKFVEVPNTNIREEVLPHQYEYDLLYSMAQEFGHAELVWYALNGKRVVEGEYTDRDYPPLSHLITCSCVADRFFYVFNFLY